MLRAMRRHHNVWYLILGEFVDVQEVCVTWSDTPMFILHLWGLYSLNFRMRTRISSPRISGTNGACKIRRTCSQCMLTGSTSTRSTGWICPSSGLLSSSKVARPCYKCPSGPTRGAVAREVQRIRSDRAVEVHLNCPHHLPLPHSRAHC
jgi:hypothetical protein